MADDLDVIKAFTADQVARLTGLSKAQLAEWDRQGFFAPQYAAENRRSPYSRIYSFKDVVGLRIISLLCGGYAVPVWHLKEVAPELARRQATWADVRLYVWKKRVHWDDPITGKPIGVTDGQFALLAVADVMTEMREQAQKLARRDDSEIGKIERHRYVAHNAPVIAGTRIRVSTIREFLEASYSVEQIISEFPALTPDDIKAVQALPKNGIAA
jgi:uncharacterized protein (DUF433 family)